TLDMELFGPSAWLTGFYLAALKAGAEIAEALGEPEIAADYRALFERGRAWVDSELFNGEYYQQRIDLHDKGVLERYAQGASMVGDALAAYWDAEHGEIKYQVGDGCGIDQLLAQWHANGCGLGDIFDLKQRRIALRALFEHLYKEPMRDSFNACRVFSLNDEAGLLICAWPAGRQQAVVPLPYAQETMTGFEYAAACLLIQEGLVEEGLRVVRAVRARFDGRKRNPWNEFECGSNYARSMASYGLLQALSGLEYNLVDGTLGFDPVPTADGRFVCFWSLGSGWVTLMHAPQEARVAVLAGELRLRRLHLPSIAERRVQAVCLGDTQVPFAQQGDWLTFGPVIVVDGQPLQVRWV
ncbi:MAG: hypothetical protein GX557_04845, partial [Chloroflexi bacterium]|nr:hypothetical protein [Chloroflexota bacterium]